MAPFGTHGPPVRVGCRWWPKDSRVKERCLVRIRHDRPPVDGRIGRVRCASAKGRVVVGHDRVTFVPLANETQQWQHQWGPGTQGDRQFAKMNGWVRRCPGAADLRSHRLGDELDMPNHALIPRLRSAEEPSPVSTEPLRGCLSESMRRRRGNSGAPVFTACTGAVQSAIATTANTTDNTASPI